MSLEELSFVMKYIGYRFQDQSLTNAVVYSGAVQWNGWRRVRTGSGRLAEVDLRRELLIAPRKADSQSVIERTSAQVAEALAARSKRLRSARRGLSRNDAVYVEGSIPPSTIG
jgi:hypothetical protein